MCSHEEAEAGAAVISEPDFTFLQRLPTLRGHLFGRASLVGGGEVINASNKSSSQ